MRDAENDLSESRLLELRENPEILGARSYDLRFLCAIHGFLFQDVYQWAGQVRTVGISKDDQPFCPPAAVATPMNHVTDEIARTDRLRSVSPENLPSTAAYLYDYVNWAHPFREGNGRSTREFFALLLAERGAGLNWQLTDTATLYAACHSARADSDLTAMVSMFATIIDAEPAYTFG